MSPLLLGAVAVGGVLAVLIGVVVHLLDRRHVHVQAILRRELDHANARADTLEEELKVVKLNLADADEALEEYREELAVYREAFPMTALAIDRQRSVN